MWAKCTHPHGVTEEQLAIMKKLCVTFLIEVVKSVDRWSAAQFFCNSEHTIFLRIILYPARQETSLQDVTVGLNTRELVPKNN